jgi:hypothetical protein
MSAWLCRRYHLPWAAASMLVRILSNMHPQSGAMFEWNGTEVAADGPLGSASTIVTSNGAAIRLISPLSGALALQREAGRL